MARRYLFHALRSFTPSVAVVGDSATYFVSTADLGVSRVVFSRGSYEQDLMAMSIEIVEEATGKQRLLDGRTFVDVGANIGTSCIPALTVFGAQDVVAFEPAPMNFKLLRCSVAANDLDHRVRAFQLALSDQSATATLELAPSNWGDHRIRTVSGLDDEASYKELLRPTIVVKTARFDDIVEEQKIDVDRVGMFWVDAQGHEGHILAGASCITDAGAPVIIEYWPYGLRRAAGLELLYELVADGYRRVFDLRASASEGRLVELPSTGLIELESRYQGLAFTDLILLR